MQSGAHKCHELLALFSFTTDRWQLLVDERHEVFDTRQFIQKLGMGGGLIRSEHAETSTNAANILLRLAQKAD